MHGPAAVLPEGKAVRDGLDEFREGGELTISGPSLGSTKLTSSATVARTMGSVVMCHRHSRISNTTPAPSRTRGWVAQHRPWTASSNSHITGVSPI